MRSIVILGLAALVGALPAGPEALGAEPAWRLEQPLPPAGGSFATPLGRPGDLQFMSPSRGLLTVEGTATVPRGLYTYDGAGWSQLATVCGGPGDTSRMAVAGPREFWTVTQPSRPRDGNGTSLCHFKDGNVIASYSTAVESPDPYRTMDAAACLGPADCWFGGFGAQDPTGERRGAFHLHWDGISLQTVYAPQGRGVTDLEAHQGKLFESVVVGSRPFDTSSPIDLFEAEPAGPRLIHRIEDRRFVADPFMPSGLSQTSELLALDSDGTRMWAAGGGAASGPAASAGNAVARSPLVARLEGDAWQEVPFPAGGFGPRDRVVDIAAVPGADHAWAAVEPFEDHGQPAAHAHVVRIGADGTTTTVRLPATGPGRGAAARIAFTSATDGWMVTSQGWLFHFTDGSAPGRDTDPAFGETIAFRPNEAAEQFVPDAPPADDSELFKPPPVEIGQAPPPPTVRRLAPLLRRVKSSVRGHTLVMRFTLTRRARVSLVARRKGRIVAHTRARMLRPGRHSLQLRLNPRRWPQRLSFKTREPGRNGSGGGPGGGSDEITTDGDTITTGGGDVITTRSGR